MPMARCARNKGVPVTMTVPSYQVTFPGGDTSVVGNFEYRIPIVGPVTLAIFADAGMDQLLFSAPASPESGTDRAIEPGISAGGLHRRRLYPARLPETPHFHRLELQVLMPVVNAPFRVYWAYNPTRFEGTLAAPIVADRSYFPNTATYTNAISSIGAVLPYSAERSAMFRFTRGDGRSKRRANWIE